MSIRNIIQDVYIRDTKLMANKIGPEWSKIERAIIQAGREDIGIPIYYQELQPRDPKTYKFKAEHIIGTASNMHVDANGKLVCDVMLNPFNDLTKHFMGVIDNYGMSVINTKKESKKSNKGKSTLTYKLERLIIYDKDRKAEVDKHVQRVIKDSKK